MSNTRNLSNLLDSNGDVKATHLDNAPTPTKSEIEGLGIAASSLTGALPAISGANLTGILTAVTLDSPSISGTLSVDSGSNVTHTIGNWSEELNYTITPTNCTVGSINASGEFIVTHTSGVPSYTIKATTDNLGLDDSSLVTKNLVVKLTAPTISSPADTPVTTNVVYTVTSTDSGDDKIILDMGTSNFTYQSVDVGSGSKVGNTVEVTGFTTGNPAITVQFTALGTYASVKAKSTNIAGTYGDSNYSSSDSIVCYEQLSSPALDAPSDTDDTTAVTYTISSINANATKVIFDAQSSNFTYGSVGSGSGSKVGNTVEITGWSGTSVTVTLTYTTAATYSNRANVTSTSATYTDSAWSSSDSIVISISSTVAVFDLFGDSSAKALYQMNGNANDTGGNYNATDTGNINYTSGGPTGIYADFQAGQTDEINIPLGSWMSNRTDFTVSLWTAPQDTGDWYYQFMLGNTSHSPQHYRLGIFHPYLSFNGGTDTRMIYPVNSSQIVFDNDAPTVWRNWVFSVTSNVCTMYRDNVQVGQISGNVGTCHSYIGVNCIPALGAQGVGNSHPNDAANVTQIRFFDRGVTTAEIATLYAEGS